MARRPRGTLQGGPRQVREAQPQAVLRGVCAQWGRGQGRRQWASGWVKKTETEAETVVRMEELLLSSVMGTARAMEVSPRRRDRRKSGIFHDNHHRDLLQAKWLYMKRK